MASLNDRIRMYAKKIAIVELIIFYINWLWVPGLPFAIYYFESTLPFAVFGLWMSFWVLFAHHTLSQYKDLLNDYVFELGNPDVINMYDLVYKSTIWERLRC